MNKIKTLLFLGSASGALLATTSLAHAQDVTEDAPKVQEKVIVVGTQIQGANIADALPVTLVDETDLDAFAISSGEDLINSIPSQGATNFSNENETGGVNGARGDVASVNLRSLGTGNTLALLNGRRLVLHPGSQSENLVPVVTPNLNALPTGGISRVEVLRDGASAIYGADAVGGVINTVLKDEYDGLQVTAKYGSYDDLDADALTLSLYGGQSFNEGRTNVTFFGSYYDRGGIHASEREYSANDDKRPLVAGTAFEDDSNFYNSSSNSPWGQFDTTQPVRQNGTLLTTSAGRFHIQPDTSAGCRADLGDGICIDDGTLNSELRHNTAVYDQMTSDLERLNTFLFFHHELNSGQELYGELSYYHAETFKTREANTPLSSTPITISKDNYWNPFGAVYHPDGTLNTNRLAGLDAPAEGLDVTIGGSDGRYRLVDAGPRRTEVENDSFRALIGMKGDWKNWDYDTAILYSEAKTSDVTHNRFSSTLFQQALNGGTVNDYNPFNGGSLTDPNGLDDTVNPSSSYEAALIDVRRDNKTSLALADFKISNDAIYALPAGDVGAAFGVEARSEDYKDDRDDRLDGTIVFTDAITGITYDSDVMGSSATPDTKGDRQTFSAWGELYVPVVSPDQSIPLIRSLDLQLAARYENASDFGDVWAPKAALSWYPVDWLQFRTSYSEGFRAPNLDQVNAEGIQRSNTRDDYYRCQAQINKGLATSLADCDQSEGVLSVRSGSDQLEAETNETFSAGFVFQPDMIIPGFTVTLDYYNIRQENVVGIAGDDLQIVLDFVRRMNGSSNTAVLRDAPDADDIAFFAGSGLDPVGDIINVADPYLNLETRISEGFDLGVYYDLDDTPLGDFGFKLDASRLLTFDQDPSSVVNEIRAESLADDISLAGNEGSLIGVDGQPKWRGTARVNWRNGQWAAGASVNYISSFYDTSAIQNTTGEFWEVDSWTTANAYIDYTFESDSANLPSATRLRLGATNLTNEEPPLADETYGYYAEYHNNRGRFVYVEARATF